MSVCTALSFSLSLSLYLCVCAARLHGKMHTLYTYMMYAFEPLNDGGASHVTAHVCSSNYWDVLSSLLQEVSLQLKTKLKMTPACAAPLQPIVRVTVPFSVSLWLNGKCKRCTHQRGFRPALIHK